MIALAIVTAAIVLVVMENVTVTASAIVIAIVVLTALQIYAVIFCFTLGIADFSVFFGTF